MIAIERTAVIMLASGRSRRFGWKDKLTQDVGGRPLIEHAAMTLSTLGALTAIAVCPSDQPHIGEMLSDRFVIAVNKQPNEGMGRSIAVGVDIAMQFKPDAVVVCMGDMPFIEQQTVKRVVEALGDQRVNIAHAGVHPGTRPPSAFDASCFEALRNLKGDEGARTVIQSPHFRVAGVAAPAPTLIDIDTQDELEFARKQMEIRNRYLGMLRGEA